ncbi:hypothetical protein LINPERPRIM_LOCUS25114, partial [Linum perenne]
HTRTYLHQYEQFHRNSALNTSHQSYHNYIIRVRRYTQIILKAHYIFHHTQALHPKPLPQASHFTDSHLPTTSQLIKTHQSTHITFNSR